MERLGGYFQQSKFLRSEPIVSLEDVLPDCQSLPLNEGEAVNLFLLPTIEQDSVASVRILYASR
jgi:hypothetical protein